MRASGAAQRGLGRVEREPDSVRKCVQHCAKIKAGPGPRVHDEPRPATRDANPNTSRRVCDGVRHEIIVSGGQELGARRDQTGGITGSGERSGCVS